MLTHTVYAHGMQSNVDVLDWELSPSQYEQLSHIKAQMRMVDASFLCSPQGPYKTLKDLWDED